MRLLELLKFSKEVIVLGIGDLWPIVDVVKCVVVVDDLAKLCDSFFFRASSLPSKSGELLGGCQEELAAGNVRKNLIIPYGLAKRPQANP